MKNALIPVLAYRRRHTAIEALIRSDNVSRAISAEIVLQQGWRERQSLETL